MQRTINRYGEFTVTENKGILKTMYQNLDPLITVDIIQKNYVDKIEKLGFSSNILVIQHFSKVYDGIEFTYSLKNKLPYIDIRGLQFNEQLVLFKSLISVATLSEKHNTLSCDNLDQCKINHTKKYEDVLAYFSEVSHKFREKRMELLFDKLTEI